MRALLDDLTRFEHIDVVGIADGRQAMGDHKRRAIRHEVVERVLNQPLGFGIDRCRGLIEQKDRRILQQGPRDRKSLLFTARKFHPALADMGVELSWQCADKHLGMRRFQGRPHFIFRGISFG